jgi:hypothetical protein
MTSWRRTRKWQGLGPGARNLHQVHWYCTYGQGQYTEVYEANYCVYPSTVILSSFLRTKSYCNFMQEWISYISVMTFCYNYFVTNGRYSSVNMECWCQLGVLWHREEADWRFDSFPSFSINFPETPFGDWTLSCLCNEPFTDEMQTLLFKDPVRTAL